MPESIILGNTINYLMFYLILKQRVIMYLKLKFQKR